VIASLTAFGLYASAPATLITVVACVLLLALRSWSNTSGHYLARNVAILLDASITLLIVLFFVFVVIRFGTLA
jgi:hypothetical protein